MLADFLRQGIPMHTHQLCGTTNAPSTQMKRFQDKEFLELS
jgi:hypothetical protein